MTTYLFAFVHAGVSMRYSIREIEGKRKRENEGEIFTMRMSMGFRIRFGVFVIAALSVFVFRG